MSNTQLLSRLQTIVDSGNTYDKELLATAHWARSPDASINELDERLAHLAYQHPAKKRDAHGDFRQLSRDLAEFEAESDGITNAGQHKKLLAQLENGPADFYVNWPDVSGKGVIDGKSALNIKRFLHAARIDVRYNEFTGDTELKGLLNHDRLDDDAFNVIQMWMATLGCRAQKETLWSTLEALAQLNRYHPVRDHLDCLSWDGVPRLDHLFIRYAGADDTPLNRTYASCFAIAAVRRIYEPGTKFDTIPILEGLQGVGKSTFVQRLAPDPNWFTDNLPVGAEPKEVIEQTSGKWIVELPELRGLSKADVNSVKAFASKQADESRMAYARKTTKRPRQFVAIGTTNGGKDQGAYLIDDTGNRRFWPIEIHGVVETNMIDATGARVIKEVDFASLELDRDQLWAEAVVRHEAGESIVLPRELWAEAARQQELRRATSAVEDDLREMLDSMEGLVQNKDLYLAVGIGSSNAPRRTQRHKDDVKRTMESLGWRFGNHWLCKPHGIRKRGWIKGANDTFLLKFDEHQKSFQKSAACTDCLNAIRDRAAAA